MNKEEKERDNKEEKDMLTVVKKTAPPFADFLNAKKGVIHKVAESNSTKNSDGLTVISKNDPWREETEWDQLKKELKDK